MKWKQALTFSEIRALEADLQSLQKRLLAIKSEIGYEPGRKEMVNNSLATKVNEHCVPGEKEMVNTELNIAPNERSVPGEKEMVYTKLDEQLRMVVCSCEELCARVDKLMGYTSGRRGQWLINISAVDWLDKSRGTHRVRPWLSRFTPMCKSRQSVVSTISQRETASLQWELAVEKQSNIMDRSDQSLVQLALSIRNRGRAALPDEDLPHQVCNLSNILCFLSSTLVCPSLTWLSLRSLNLESASALDQSILTWIPSVATWITTLGDHRSICLAMVASSTIISTGATALPVWKSCMRGRSSAYVSSWLLIAVGSVLWSSIGGSVAGLFLEFMPFALGLGVALGLLWHKRMSNPQ